MSLISSYDTKEQIKRAIDIVDLVGDYLPLRREGRNFKALCPWHNDSRPSLHVNPERQSFKCWVCDIGGDIFNFVMKMEGVEFREALTMLADRAGIPLAAQRPSQGGSAVVDEKQLLYQAMAWAEEQYHQCLLHAAEAEAARRYLAERGITADSIARFRLGFAPEGWDWLLSRAQKTSHKIPTLERLGLVVRRQAGSGYYDRFRGRVLFSIRDPQRKPVALGGRILPGVNTQEAAKYINSPESPLFSKSGMLYGLDLARESMTQSRTAIVMEGYTDVILAHQCGFTNAVAVLGTALGERHLPLLRRFADRVVLMLDGDDAGQRRTNEVLGLFVQEQVDLQILTLPEKLDPCDFLIHHGAEAFRRQLEETVDALEHKFRVATLGIDGASGIHQTQQATEEILATLAQAPRLQTSATGAARVKEDQILHRLARRFGLVEDTLRKRLAELRRTGRSRPAPRAAVAATAAAAPEPPVPALERALWELLLQAPEQIAVLCEQIVLEQLQSPRSRIIFMKCRELFAAGVLPTFDRLMLEFDEPQMKNLLVELDEQGRAKEGCDPAVGLRDALETFGRQQRDQQSRRERAALEQHRLDDNQALELLNQVIERQRTRLGDHPVS